jgi:hypothetical protein
MLQDTFTTTLAELVRQVVIVIVGLVLLTRLSSPAHPHHAGLSAGGHCGGRASSDVTSAR